MKGDFSRLRFNRGKNYTSVLQQQGRVALDADANEQCAINNYLRDTEALDIVGRWGGPAGDEGFEISVQGGALAIGRGRYYVDGILCENEVTLPYAEQPFLIGPSPTDTALLQSVAQGSIHVIQVYLQVWQRLVTALDDPCLREPALGQADTTARLQTVWQVVAETPAVHVLQTNPYELFRNCCAEMSTLVEVQGPFGKLSAITGGGGGDCSCQPTPAAGYLGLENQLYRVEIQQGGDATEATFKWSRENGSVVAAITGVSGRQVYVDSLGFDANLGFSPGQWVEISDDSYLFGPNPNQPGDLYQIQAVTPETLSLTMTQPVAAVDPTKNARVRRWDQFGSSAGSNGIGISVGSPFVLENGIQIQFTAGQYNPGDYWLIPARTATGEIDWPPCDSDGSVFQPPHHTQVFRAPLACIQWDSTKGKAVVHDCRDKFYPLTQLTPPAPPAALHVSKISWANDDVMTLDQLVASGLTVTLDQAAPASQYVTPANFTVTVEVALPIGPASSFQQQSVAMPEAALRVQDFLTAAGVSRGFSLAKVDGKFVTLIRLELILDGETSAQGSNLLWRAPWEERNPAETLTLEMLDIFLLLGAVRNDLGRVRVKLLGRMLFADGLDQVFLDGQCFGMPALRADGSTPRIDLQLPSGNEAQASDFESWFYLAPTQAVVNFSIDHPTLLVEPNGTVVDANVPTGGAVSPQGTVTLTYPAIADTVVNLSLTGPSAAGIFTLPASVKVLKGQTTKTFPITIQGNPGPSTQSWQIIASVTNALGIPFSQQATITITGSQAVSGLTFNYPTLGIQFGPNKAILVLDATNRSGGVVAPLGTVSLTNAAQAATVVTLSITGGRAGLVTVPQNVTIPANQKSATFPITIAAAPTKTQGYTVTATLTPSVGSPSTQKATLTLKNLT